MDYAWACIIQKINYRSADQVKAINILSNLILKGSIYFCLQIFHNWAKNLA